ncbi:MAG: ROK family protein [Eubacteriales bacterium]|nr:ROK family protein [Eubacteriales bacterium]
MKHYIGIDLGGTNIKGALVNENGEIIKQNTCPTYAEQGVEAVTENIANMIRNLAEGVTIDGVGMGCPGTVDDKAGTVVYACNIGWVDYDVRTALKELTGYDVCLVNDANAAALAEVVVGAVKGAESAVVVTLGTGVGGGVVIDGKLLTGYTGAASELGHMVIIADGEECACGRRGCFEAYASATALIRMTHEAMEKHPESAMHQIAAELGGVDGRTTFTAQQMGDAVGDEVVKTYVHYLSIGIANIVNIFFPEVIALSGGVANQGENLLVPLRAEVQQQEYGAAYTAKHPRIVCCTLGNTAGMIGAAMFAKE